jgi:hypothetical protein
VIFVLEEHKRRDEVCVLLVDLSLTNNIVAHLSNEDDCLVRVPRTGPELGNLLLAFEELDVDSDGFLTVIVTSSDLLALLCKLEVVEANLLGVFALLRGNRLLIGSSVNLSKVLHMDVETHLLE